MRVSACEWGSDPKTTPLNNIIDRCFMNSVNSFLLCFETLVKPVRLWWAATSDCNKLETPDYMNNVSTASDNKLLQ